MRKNRLDADKKRGKENGSQGSGRNVRIRSWDIERRGPPQKGKTAAYSAVAEDGNLPHWSHWRQEDEISTDCTSKPEPIGKETKRQEKNPTIPEKKRRQSEPTLKADLSTGTTKRPRAYDNGQLKHNSGLSSVLHRDEYGRSRPCADCNKLQNGPGEQENRDEYLNKGFFGDPRASLEIAMQGKVRTRVEQAVFRTSRQSPLSSPRPKDSLLLKPDHPVPSRAWGPPRPAQLQQNLSGAILGHRALSIFKPPCGFLQVSRAEVSKALLIELHEGVQGQPGQRLQAVQDRGVSLGIGGAHIQGIN
eukprot:RCo001470